MTEALVDFRRPTVRLILLPVHRYLMLSDHIAVLQLRLSTQVKVTFINVYDRTWDALQKSLMHFTTHFSKQSRICVTRFSSFWETSAPKFSSDAKDRLFWVYTHTDAEIKMASSTEISVRKTICSCQKQLFTRNANVISPPGKEVADGIQFSIRSTTSYYLYASSCFFRIHNLGAGHLLKTIIGS